MPCHWGTTVGTIGNKPKKEARTLIAEYYDYAHTAELPDGKQTAISEPSLRPALCHVP